MKNNRSQTSPLQRRLSETSECSENVLSEDLFHGVSGIEIYVDRDIYLSGTINGDSSTNIMKQLLSIYRSGSEEPLYLWINSYGGTCSDTMAIIRLLESMPNPIISIVTGICYSAAILLLLCAKKEDRYAFIDAEFMIHEAQLEYSAGLSTAATALVNATKLNDVYKEIVDRETNLPEQVHDSIFSYGSDEYFLLDKALEWGLVGKEFTSLDEIFKQEKDDD